MPMENLTVGSRLSRVMLDRDMSAADLARASGLKESTISNILSGRRKSPRGETVRLLATALGVPADYLYGDSEELTRTDAPPLPEYAMALVEQMRRLTDTQNLELLVMARALVSASEDIRQQAMLDVAKQFAVMTGRGEQLEALFEVLGQIDAGIVPALDLLRLNGSDAEEIGEDDS